MPKVTPYFQTATSETMTENKLLRKFTQWSPLVVIPNNGNNNNNNNNNSNNKKKSSCTLPAMVSPTSPDSRPSKRSRLETDIKGLSIKEQKRELEEIKSGQNRIQSCQQVKEKVTNERDEEDDTDQKDADDGDIEDNADNHIKEENTYKENDDDEDFDDKRKARSIDELEYELPVTRSATTRITPTYTNFNEHNNNSDDDDDERLTERISRYNNRRPERDSGSSSTSKVSNKRQSRKLLGNNTSSTCYSDSTFCNKSSSNTIKTGVRTTTTTANTTRTLSTTKNTNKKKNITAATVNNKKRSWTSYSSPAPLFSECTRHGKNNQKSRNNSEIKGRLCINDITMTDKVLGEGQIGKVFYAKYKGLPVACKTKRKRASRENYEYQVLRELTFAAKLSACKYMNRYVGWFNCQEQKSETNEDVDNSNNNNNSNTNGSNNYNNTGSTSSSATNNSHNNTREDNSICIVQRYIPNGDSRKYLYKRSTPFRPYEVLQATICLFTALKDAHNLGIGIVDLKLENFLIDSAGSGWITDFGSCIEFEGEDVVSLDAMGVTWTTHVAAPEMISRLEFRKASDVFMATLIAAELMTGHLTDKGFQDEVLRRQLDGQVNFTSSGLSDKFKAFFPILKSGLRNDPEDRPTAEAILRKLIAIRDESYLGIS